MQKFAIVSKKDEKSHNVESKIRQKLEENNFVYDKTTPNLVISIGGDGTLLYAVHLYKDRMNDVKFLAIHTGTLGFFTDYTEEEIDEAINDIITNKEYEVFESRLLEGRINGEEIFYALNEIRIENICKTQILDIYIDKEFFETVKGNGMCLSTQAGSTAYNRSLKGAVIDSGLEVMQLCEIAGIQNAKHSSLGNPYIMKSDRKVSFVCDDSTGAYVCFDHIYIKSDDIKVITCKLSEKSVSFIRFKKYSYLDRLRNLY